MIKDVSLRLLYLILIGLLSSEPELTDRILIFGERHLRTAPTTTVGGHIARCDFTRHAPNLQPQTLTPGGSDADRYWEG